MASQEFTMIDPRTGSVEAAGSQESLFNAFYGFKYSGGVDAIDASTYTSNTKDKNFTTAAAISNPTASEIVKWSQALPQKAKASSYGVQNSPYAWFDFLFCKWYGRIPNNRLVTLRKFPLATQDDLGVKRAGVNQNIPVAQAVTWFGGDTGNELNKIWQSSWDIPWTKKDIKAQDVQGNEITNFSQALTKGLGAEAANPFWKALIQDLAITADQVSNGSVDARNAALVNQKLEQKQQDYLKGLWGDNGAFFNQLQGPVNVKNNFLIRDRGLSTGAPDDKWTLVFEYRTDSYFGLNQRRVALDIIANMLSLTYSDGEWLSSLNVYYKKLGIALRPDEQSMVEAAMSGGVLDPTALAKAFAKIAKTRAESILQNGLTLAAETGTAVGNTAYDAVKSFFTGSEFSKETIAKEFADKPELQNVIEIELTKALAESYPAFLQMRASVPGGPTGNWHLTIGNPMNPIMRIGDVVVRSCSVEFGSELGVDDFPIDLKFTVTLSPTKPRDGQDIRRSFNIGRTDFIDRVPAHTADQANTYGRINSDMYRWSNESVDPKSAATSESRPHDTPSTEKVQKTVNWLNSRYGKGFADDKFVQDVYFYVPPRPDQEGGTGKPAKNGTTQNPGGGA